MQGLQRYDESLSKALSLILRATALENELQIDEQGFVDLQSILRLPRFRNYSVNDVQKVVEHNEKNRFALRIHPQTNQLQIRANQGHSIPNIDPDLREIVQNEFESAVHRTTRKAYQLIRIEGLNRMDRNHIHFYPPEKKPFESDKDRDLVIQIFVDLNSAIKEGLKFYLSQNTVILCPGDQDGFLPSRFFKKVVDVDKGLALTDFNVSRFNPLSCLIEDWNKFEKLIHPTVHKDFSLGRRAGFNKTKGLYVNFLTSEPESGYQVLVYLDMRKARENNLRFIQYEANELLCLDSLSPSLFEKAIEVNTGKRLPL